MRLVALLLALFVAAPASAQVFGPALYVPPASSGPVTCTGPLDVVADTPLVAYSFRKLKSSYAGFAAQLKRASDSATQNIGFSGCDFDKTAAATFCNATTCTVIWYDQGGSGANSSAGAGTTAPGYSAPCQNSQPCATFSQFAPNGLDATTASVTALTISAVANFSGGPSFPAVARMGGSGNGWSMLWDKTNLYMQRIDGSNHNALIALAGGAFDVAQGTINSTLSRVFLDGVKGTDNTDSVSLASETTLQIGHDVACASNCNFNGSLSEVVVFAPDISTTDANAVQANQKAYWGTP